MSFDAERSRRQLFYSHRLDIAGSDDPSDPQFVVVAPCNLPHDPRLPDKAALDSVMWNARSLGFHMRGYHGATYPQSLSLVDEAFRVYRIAKVRALNARRERERPDREMQRMLDESAELYRIQRAARGGRVLPFVKGTRSWTGKYADRLKRMRLEAFAREM